MKNQILFFYFLYIVVPFFAHADSSSPLMMLKGWSNEKTSSNERSIQNQRNRTMTDDDLSRAASSEIEADGVDEGRTDLPPTIRPSLEQRFQQTEELQFLAAIARKMEAQLQVILNGIEPEAEVFLAAPNLSEQMNEEEQSFIQRIADEVGDQTRDKMTEAQIAMAMIQEQQKTQQVLAAYYNFLIHPDAQESGEATENLSDYAQIKADLSSAIRGAFIKIQRAYFSNIILESVVEKEWEEYQQGGGIRHPYALVSSSVVATVPGDLHQEAIRAIELQSVTRTAHQTDEELHRAFMERGYSDDGEGERLEARRVFFTRDNDLDRNADELMRVRGGIHASMKVEGERERAYERCERSLNNGEVNFDTQSSRSTTPDFLSAEERIAHDQASTIGRNLEMMVYLGLKDELVDEEEKAFERYQKAMEGYGW